MDTKILKIYADGGAKDNPGPAAFGVVFKDENDNELFQHSESIGETTNNVAEYRGLLYALKNAKRYHPDEVKLYLDSKLVVKQMQGKYKIKNEGMQELFLKCWNKKLDFDQISFKHIPRDKNREADALVKKELNQASLEI